MLDLGRTTAPIRLAEALEHDIREGRWKGNLPGYRVLSRHYGVSRITCDGAFDLLERRGILAQAEPRKSRRILATAQPSESEAGAQVGTLLIIIDTNQQDASADPLIGKICDQWIRLGGDVEQVADDLARYRTPRTRLAKWIARENPDCLVLYVAPSTWLSAAKESGLPYHALGGALPKDEDPPSGSGFDTLDTYQMILERLAALGHRRILLPTHLGGRRLRGAMLTAYARVFSKGDQEDGHEDWVPLFQELDPKVWQSYWHRAFVRQQPTAVVVENAYALLSLYGYCMEQGIRIPRDLSVVCGSNEEDLLWTHPVPTRMRYPTEKAVRHFQSWVQHGFRNNSFKFLTLDWVEGETLAPPGK